MRRLVRSSPATVSATAPAARRASAAVRPTSRCCSACRATGHAGRSALTAAATAPQTPGVLAPRSRQARSCGAPKCCRSGTAGSPSPLACSPTLRVSTPARPSASAGLRRAVPRARCAFCPANTMRYPRMAIQGSDETSSGMPSLRASAVSPTDVDPLLLRGGRVPATVDRPTRAHRTQGRSLGPRGLTRATTVCCRAACGA